MTIQGPRLLLVPRVTRKPQFNGVTGSVGNVLLAMFGPQQHDSHVGRYRWNRTMRDADRRAERVAKLADEICAKARWRTP
jgi:hypothetical protein